MLQLFNLTHSLLSILLQKIVSKTGENRIRRNSLTTLHSLPTTQSDIPPPQGGLVRQTTVPHGFNVSQSNHSWGGGIEEGVWRERASMVGMGIGVGEGA